MVTAVRSTSDTQSREIRWKESSLRGLRCMRYSPTVQHGSRVADSRLRGPSVLRQLSLVPETGGMISLGKALRSRRLGLVGDSHGLLGIRCEEMRELAREVLDAYRR